MLLFFLYLLLPFTCHATTLLLLETPFGFIAGADSRSSVPSTFSVVNPLSDKIMLITPNTLNLPATVPFFCVALMRTGTTSLTQHICRNIISACHDLASSSLYGAPPCNTWPLISVKTGLPPPTDPTLGILPPITLLSLLALLTQHVTAPSTDPNGAHGALLSGYAHAATTGGAVSGVFEHMTRNSNVLDHSLKKRLDGRVADMQRSGAGLVTGGSGGRDARGVAESALKAIQTDTYTPSEALTALKLEEGEVEYVDLAARSVLHAIETDQSSGGIARIVVVKREGEGAGSVKEILLETRRGKIEVLAVNDRLQ